MKKISMFGAGILAACFGALVGSSVTAATRAGSLPVVKTRFKAPTAVVKETAFNRFIVSYPVTRASADVVRAVTEAAARVGLYGLRARADGTKAEFKVAYNRKLAVAGTHALKLSHGITAAEADALALALKQAGAKHAHPDYRMQPMATPNDPQYGLQWDFNRPDVGVNVESAWELTSGEGAVVAVVDTGYRPHQDLIENIVPGYDFVSDPESSNDGDGRDGDPIDSGDFNPYAASTWHGTHVAGTIGAVTNNGIGIAGMAHGAKIQPVRVIGGYGGHWSDIIDGLVWASGGHVDGAPDNKSPATVVNVSLGGYTPQGCEATVFQDVVDAALARGVTIVAAAGNDNWNAHDFTPASCAGVITVGASSADGARSDIYSNYGQYVSISAPGGNGRFASEPYDHFIWSLGNTGIFAPVPSPEGDTITLMEGTSMSAPHVSATVALMQAAAKKVGRAPWSPADIKAILKRTATPWTTQPPWSRYQGPGIVNAGVAVWEATRDLPSEAERAYTLIKAYPIARQTATARESLVYKIDVPRGRTSFVVRTYGGIGDLDLYVKLGGVPKGTTDAGAKKSVRVGNTETVTFAAPAPGTYYIRAYSKVAFGEASILASF